MRSYPWPPTSIPVSVEHGSTPFAPVWVSRPWVYITPVPSLPKKSLFLSLRTFRGSNSHCVDFGVSLFGLRDLVGTPQEGRSYRLGILYLPFYRWVPGHDERLGIPIRKLESRYIAFSGRAICGSVHCFRVLDSGDSRVDSFHDVVYRVPQAGNER